MKLRTLICLLLVAGLVQAGDSLKTNVEKLSKGDHRSAQNIARNQYRNPAETLAFFGLKEDMHVVEISPGGGWYMEILAPLLRDKGTYVAAGYDPASTNERVQQRIKGYNAKKEAHPNAYDKVVDGVFSGSKMDLGKAGSADMVLTFRNVHNWMGGDYSEKAFKAFFDVLKPGGVLGLVEHRGPGGEQDPKAQNGYVNQDAVIKMAEAAGFKLEASSEVNANPKDTKNHPRGVWTLPPVLAGDYDEAQYKAIGESDRMTLKFVKP